MPRSKRDAGPGEIVRVDDETVLLVPVPAALESLDTRAINFVLEGVESYGSRLAEEVEEAPEEARPELAARLGNASFGATKLLLGAVDRHAEQLQGLSPGRRRALVWTLDNVLGLMLTSAYEKDVSAKQLERQGEVAIDTLRILVGGHAGRLESLIDALEVPAVEGYVDVSEEEAEARARLRRQALYQRVIRDSFSVAELGRQTGISRQRLKQLRDQGRLFAIEVPFHRGLLYPRWQFAPATGKPREEMPRLIEAGRDGGLDAIGFHVMMNNPAAGGGLSPLDLLEDGEEAQVMAILRGADQ